MYGIAYYYPARQHRKHWCWCLQQLHRYGQHCGAIHYATQHRHECFPQRTRDLCPHFPCGTLDAYTEAWGTYFTQIVEDCGQGIDDIVTDDIKVYVQDGRIVVEGADSELRVFDVAGRQVANQALPTGIYFIRIGDRITRKIAVVR